MGCCGVAVARFSVCLQVNRRHPQNPAVIRLIASVGHSHMNNEYSISQFIHNITLSEQRERLLGPKQFQLLLVACFMLPVALKCVYHLGIPCPASLGVRFGVLLIALITLLLTYRAICRSLGIPQTGTSTTHPGYQNTIDR